MPPAAAAAVSRRPPAGRRISNRQLNSIGETAPAEVGCCALSNVDPGLKVSGDATKRSAAEGLGKKPRDDGEGAGLFQACCGPELGNDRTAVKPPPPPPSAQKASPSPAAGQADSLGMTGETQAMKMSNANPALQDAMQANGGLQGPREGGMSLGDGASGLDPPEDTDPVERPRRESGIYLNLTEIVGCTFSPRDSEFGRGSFNKKKSDSKTEKAEADLGRSQTRTSKWIEDVIDVTQTKTKWWSALYDKRIRPYRRPLCCCGWTVLFTVISLVLSIILVSDYLAEELMYLDSRAQRGTPESLPDFFAGKCRHLKETFRPVLRFLEAYNARLGWSQVSFSAREDGREVSALFFPSLLSHAPLIVIAHDAGLSNMDSTVQTAAYFLRLMNFSVLAPNMRNAGSDFGQRVNHWQNAPRDLLGAWDYATKVLRFDQHRVGIMGFGFGGLAVQVAFAQEPTIPAIFLDGAVHNVEKLLASLFDQRVPSSFAWLFWGRTWSLCQHSGRGSRKTRRG
eukprot:gnl/TRDRNA2_/TRDRNA2_94334_c0_seq2.p1 gnl/TRDRNA2_/TRDRNA2_94334_c0~~gnl/TRDRNA2_/TRDRNA2_94334_c0_seq2.p1  ORF type:complete len:511 (-),score=65.36 gnl/TRDRNA2_/TRDRNA2_94334_c0_seq2:462-1994(-)